MGASAIGLSHVAVQFPVYEFFKKWLGERRQRERGEGEANIADRLSTVDLIVASSTSKVIGPPPARLPAHQLAVCASGATVTLPSAAWTLVSSPLAATPLLEASVITLLQLYGVVITAEPQVGPGSTWHCCHQQ